MRHDDDLRFKLEGTRHEVCIDGMGINVPMPSPYGSTGQTFVMTKANPLYAGVMEWHVKYVKYNTEFIDTSNYVEKYTEMFGTWSQISKAWPNLFSLFPGQAQGKVVKNLNRVRMPEDYWEEPFLPIDQRVPAPDYRPDVQHKYEQWLSEGLMVPEDSTCIARLTP